MRSIRIIILKFKDFPSPAKYGTWKMDYRKTISSSSGQPSKALEWILKQDTTKTVEELADDEGFETLSSKIAAGLSKILHGECAGLMSWKRRNSIKTVVF